MNRSRSGSLLVETCCAIALVTTALVGVSQLFILTGQQQRDIEWRRQATREAGNVMERIMVRDFRDVTAQGLAAVQPSEDVRRQLPSVRLGVEVADSPQLPAARQVRVVVAWRNRGGNEDRVALEAWKYAPAN